MHAEDLYYLNAADDRARRDEIEAEDAEHEAAYWDDADRAYEQHRDERDEDLYDNDPYEGGEAA